MSAPADAKRVGLVPAQRIAAAKVIRYEHGGGRMYVDDASAGGSRELIADLYREDMREYVVHACNSHERLVGLLKRYMAAYPAFRMKPCGAPGSQARDEQERLMALEDAAMRALSPTSAGAEGASRG